MLAFPAWSPSTLERRPPVKQEGPPHGLLRLLRIEDQLQRRRGPPQSSEGPKNVGEGLAPIQGRGRKFRTHPLFRRPITSVVRAKPPPCQTRRVGSRGCVGQATILPLDACRAQRVVRAEAERRHPSSGNAVRALPSGSKVPRSAEAPSGIQGRKRPRELSSSEALEPKKAGGAPPFGTASCTKMACGDWRSRSWPARLAVPRGWVVPRTAKPTPRSAPRAAIRPNARPSPPLYRGCP